MQIPEYPIQISIELGYHKQQLQKLMHMHLANYSQPQQVAQVKARAKVNENYGDDFVIMFRYSITPGRQQQAVKYLKQGLYLQINKKEMSPLQYLLTRPPQQHQATVEVINEGAGFVVIKYRLFSQSIQDFKIQVLNPLAKIPTVHLDLSLEGFVSHSLKNLTNVKVGHALFNASSQENFVPIIKQILNEQGLIESQMIQNPFYSCYGSLKKMKVNLKMKGFRQLVKFSNAIQQSIYQKKSQKEDSKYSNTGLFRQNVSAYIFYKDTLGIEGVLKHHGQDVFMRLVKVYFKAAKKMS